MERKEFKLIVEDILNSSRNAITQSKMKHHSADSCIGGVEVVALLPMEIMWELGAALGDLAIWRFGGLAVWRLALSGQIGRHRGGPPPGGGGGGD